MSMVSTKRPPFSRRGEQAKAKGQRPQIAADCRDSAGHGSKTAAIRERAILALLSTNSISKAAAKCGVSERTLRTWKVCDEDFKRALAEAQRTVLQAGIDRVQVLMAVAIDTLEALMDRAMPPSVRLGAARTVAELGIHQNDAETIMRRLDEIESLQRQQDAARRR